jgi:hypothetical protein
VTVREVCLGVVALGCRFIAEFFFLTRQKPCTQSEAAGDVREVCGCRRGFFDENGNCVQCQGGFAENWVASWWDPTNTNNQCTRCDTAKGSIAISRNLRNIAPAYENAYTVAGKDMQARAAFECVCLPGYTGQDLPSTRPSGEFTCNECRVNTYKITEATQAANAVHSSARRQPKVLH